MPGQAKLHKQASSSVWIDPAAQPHLSTSFLASEKKQQMEHKEYSPSFNPVTPPALPASPIPARTSAHPGRVVKRRPRYTHSVSVAGESDVTDVPTRPQSPIWQYESLQYDAESSLPTLSLVAVEERQPDTVSNEVAIDEIDTLYPTHLHNHYGPIVWPQPVYDDEQLDIAEQCTRPDTMLKEDEDAQPVSLHAVRNTWISDVPTVPDAVMQPTMPHVSPIAMSFVPPTRPLSELVQERLQPRTVGRDKNSSSTKRILARDNASVKKGAPALNAIDKLRWWLLCPGRMEFVLWFAGALLLIAITCVFLFVSALSFGWLSSTNQTPIPSMNTIHTIHASTPIATVTTSPHATTTPAKPGTPTSHTIAPSGSSAHAAIRVVLLKERTAPVDLHSGSIWLWLVICGYLMAVVMFGLAIIFHHRYHP